MLFISTVCNAQIYKCTGDDGKVGFRDKPCELGYKTEKFSPKNHSLNEKNWKEKLRSSRHDGITLVRITDNGEDSYVIYDFIDTKSSNNFIRLLAKISGKHINLLKFKVKKGKAGQAKAQVTTKTDNLFSKMNN